MTESVSVVISSYNYGRYIAEAIESVLSQTVSAAEVIVVDDGSSDDSRDIIRRYPVTLIAQENAGQAAALNAGVAACGGTVIALLDADDFWEADKIERTIDALVQHPEAVWLRHKLEMIDEQRARIGVTIPSFQGSRATNPDAAAVSERLITASTSALLLRKSVAASVFPLPEMRYDADAIIVARLASKHAGWQLDEKLGYYRRHSAQQFGATDVERLLERQIAVTSLVAAEVGRPEPVSNHKHRIILAFAAGKPRGAIAVRGFRAALRLAKTPRRMFRQAASLAFAAFAPAKWLERFRRNQGFI